MAITSTYNYRDADDGTVNEKEHVVKGYVDGPASYANGTGFAADILTDFGLSSAGVTVGEVKVTSDLGYGGKWGSNLIVAYDAGTEVSNAADLSGVRFYIEAEINES
tara:strand:+ start:1633 stop:1953 length:321 start_codon:yes stop_codon:yes gene_type:complete